MNITNLEIIVIVISILGVLLSSLAFFISYYVTKKRDKQGMFKEYVQTPLTNSDISIGEAIKYLKIVNNSEDVKKLNENV